ncbi:MAG: ABC transporter ATP-binding protein [Longimicrobiales bacterium]
MSDPVLEVRDLTVRVPAPDGGTVAAVDGVSFTLASGERLGLVGESGAGKSLTTLALPGLLPPGVRLDARSSVRIAGTELVGAPRRVLRGVRGRRIAMVFQDPGSALNPALSVGAQIREVLAVHRNMRGAAARSETLRLLGEVGLPDPARTADDPPHRLSGGMRQRACIAVALAGDPDVLVADEPTTALDVTVQARILDLLVHLSESRGLALLLVSHDLAVVARACHRVVVLYAGQVVEEGPVGPVLHDPLHPYTRALLAARPTLTGPRGVPTPIPGAIPAPSAWPSGCRFHPRCAEVLDRCAVDDPVLPTRGDRSVACWLHHRPPGGTS